MTTLFHYCPTDSFYSIIRSRSIWLSSLTLSNDSKEGAVILEVLLSLAHEANLDTYARERLEGRLHNAFQFFDGLGFCLSERGDLLSQWRGYADDGRGVCVGFSKDYLELLGSRLRERDERSFALKRLIYDSEEQKDVARDDFEEIRRHLDVGAFRSALGTLLTPTTDEEKANITTATEKGMLAILKAMLRMFEIKNPAFSEEKEWRLISFFTRTHQENVSFRPRGNRIIPYFQIELEDLGMPAITEIIVGPKHETPNYVIDRFLKTHSFGSVRVSSSSATYR